MRVTLNVSCGVLLLLAAASNARAAADGAGGYYYTGGGTPYYYGGYTTNYVFTSPYVTGGGGGGGGGVTRSPYFYDAAPARDVANQPRWWDRPGFDGGRRYERFDDGRGGSGFRWTDPARAGAPLNPPGRDGGSRDGFRDGGPRRYDAPPRLGGSPHVGGGGHIGGGQRIGNGPVGRPSPVPLGGNK